MRKKRTAGKYERRHRLLQKIFISYGGKEKDAWDFAFHMLDWDEDLERLYGVYSNPGRLTNKKGDAVFRFLIHATYHLMEAYRLLRGEECVNIFAPNYKQPTSSRKVTGRTRRLAKAKK